MNAPVLTTPRLILRPMTLADARGYGALLRDPRVYPWISEQGPVSHDEVPDRIQRNQHATASGRHLYLAIASADDDAFLGYVAAHEIDGPTISISYAVVPEHWRCGVMREALGAVVPWLFTRFRPERVQAQVHPRNAASLATLAGAGFAVAGPVDADPADPGSRITWARAR